MGTRLELQTLLSTILGDNTRVYFQPPPTLTMAYPCIVYKRDDVEAQHADNEPYDYTVRYLITLIDRAPDSAFFDPLIKLRMCTFDRAYQADGLNHDVFQLFF